MASDAFARLFQLVDGSAAARVDWKDRGQAPLGYSRGMALMFARTCCLLNAGDTVALEMAKAEDVNAHRDALTWYEPKFQALGLSNAASGADTLRHLFVLMVGLGMRESSGRHCEGRDTSADNTSADTAEAGLLQVSYNSASAHPLLQELIGRFSGRRDLEGLFSRGVHCGAEAWRDWGEGPGRDFQGLTKACPAFAVQYAGVAMRHIRTHWGPLNSRHAELRLEWDDLLQSIQGLIEEDGVCEALALEPSSAKPHAKPAGDEAGLSSDILGRLPGAGTPAGGSVVALYEGELQGRIRALAESTLADPSPQRIGQWLEVFAYLSHLSEEPASRATAQMLIQDPRAFREAERELTEHARREIGAFLEALSSRPETTERRLAAAGQLATFVVQGPFNADQVQVYRGQFQLSGRGGEALGSIEAHTGGFVASYTKKFGPTPPGVYRVSNYRPDRPGEPDMHLHGVSYSFDLDPVEGTEVYGRDAFRVHPDGGPLGTHGCVGVFGSADELRSMAAALANLLEGGAFTLRVDYGS